MVNKSTSLSIIICFRALNTAQNGPHRLEPSLLRNILIEVEEFETAVTVLEGLLDENEDDPQIWLMVGWANYLQGEDYKSNARFYLKKCKEVYVKTKYEDEGLLKHTEELRTELGPGDDDEDDAEEDGDDVKDLEIDSDTESESNTNNDSETKMEH